MAMDYPAAKDWSLYYAQSVSLTRFLVEQGAPEQFVQFVREFAARWCRRRPARACIESADSPSFKNDGSTMRAADRIAQSGATRTAGSRAGRRAEIARSRTRPT